MEKSFAYSRDNIYLFVLNIPNTRFFMTARTLNDKNGSSVYMSELSRKPKQNRTFLQERKCIWLIEFSSYSRTTNRTNTEIPCSMYDVLEHAKDVNQYLTSNHSVYASHAFCVLKLLRKTSSKLLSGSLSTNFSQRGAMLLVVTSKWRVI